MLRNHPDREELRIALVMNGGVSLAIWIGGLTHEVNRVVRGEGVYGELLDLLGIEPRVDVISGTSAGGINGAFLALALARDQPLDLLQQLWVEKGAFGALLGDPLDPLPSALLRGDAYFLRELEKAFSMLAAGGGATTPNEVPLDLTLTTTLLGGEPVDITDDFGRAIADVRHTGLFTFRRGPDVKGDAFADPQLVQQLALASRSTSCFPIAFEPSFVPVKPEREVPGRPDMKDRVNFSQSRFVVDGGLLDNKPLAPAIKAIYRQRIAGDARRVLLYVIPDPGETAATEADVFASPPEVRDVLITSLFQIPRVESVEAEIQTLRLRNRRVLERRESRLHITARTHFDQARDDIRDLSFNLFPVYQEQRATSAISYIVSQLSDGLAEQALKWRAAAAEGRRPGGSEGQLWPERQSHRAWLRQAFRQVAHLPWVPREHPESPDDGELAAKNWSWGIRSVEQAADQMLDLLRRTQALMPLGHPRREKEHLPAAWQEAYDLVASLRKLREDDDLFWKKQARSLAMVLKMLREPQPEAGDALSPTAQLTEWVKVQLRVWRPPAEPAAEEAAVRPEAARPPRPAGVQEQTGELAHRIARHILQVAELSREVLATASGSPLREDREAAEALSSHLDYLVPFGTSRHQEVLLRLIWLGVVQSALGGGADEPDQFVELMQVSANTPSPFGGPAKAADKLTGVQLGHFGAFYSRSWRANDWMFGRLDGAANLIAVILNPDRLRRIALGWPRGASRPPLSTMAAARLAAVAGLPGAGTGDPQLLRELHYLDDLELPAPDALPAWCDAIARRLQLEILQKELVALAAAVELDRSETDMPPGPGSRLRIAVAQALDGGALPPEEALRIFRSHLVGEEKIAAQFGTDSFTATTARTLAVASSVLHHGGRDLGPLRFLFVGVRAVALAFHLMGQNLLRPSRTYAAAVGALMAAGLTVVMLKVFGVDIDNKVVLLGLVVLTGGLLVALFRAVTGVLLSVIVFTALYSWWPKIAKIHPLLETGTVKGTLALAAILAALWAFGTLRRPLWWVRLRERYARWRFEAWARWQGWC